MDRKIDRETPVEHLYLLLGEVGEVAQVAERARTVAPHADRLRQRVDLGQLCAKRW